MLLVGLGEQFPNVLLVITMSHLILAPLLLISDSETKVRFRSSGSAAGALFGAAMGGAGHLTGCVSCLWAIGSGSQTVVFCFDVL